MTQTRDRFRPLPWSHIAPVVQVLVITAVWAGTSVVSMLRYALAAGVSGNPDTLLSLAGTYLICYAPWIGATPFIARAVVRFPLRGPRWLKHAAVHLALSAPTAYLVVVIGQLAHGLAHPSTISWSVLAIPNLTLYLEALLYLGTAGVLEGLARGAEARRRELELNTLHVQRLELENDLRDAQLEALRMKLNPHFLFNALQTVTALMRTDAPAAERMLARLGDVLRMALRLDLSCEIPLKDEVDVARAYLDLERIRFQDRLSVAIEIDADLRDALVPSLILQPVVENAIRHGVGRLKRHADLCIGARRRDDDLLISVRDNGVGFMQGHDGGITPGVGLGVLQSRLAKLYPGRADCRLQNRPEGGAEVEIRLPYHTAAAEAPA